MRNFVLILCTMMFVTVSQVAAQSIQTTLQSEITSAPVQPIQQAAPIVSRQILPGQPMVTTTAQPAVYQQPVYEVQQQYQPQQQYYQASRPQYYQPTRNYYRPPVRRANYNSVPITQRPNRPGHVYGNTVRFLYRLGR